MTAGDVALARLILTTVLILLSLSSLAADISGKVVGIADGDTFTLLTAQNQQVKIRLAEIDAPESGQPYGEKSRQALSELVFGKNVRVAVQTTDQYGRTVGRPYVGDLDICAEMVRGGAAWAYRRYLRDQALLTLESKAKAEKRGLWGLSEAQNAPPWEWRRSGGGNQTGNCQIKGNISSKGERIYHVPGSRGYGPTRIDTSKGERWFCSEAEAQAAGWRAPQQ
jgi:endonuclease YncB( thermonuclease family)